MWGCSYAFKVLANINPIYIGKTLFINGKVLHNLGGLVVGVGVESRRLGCGWIAR
jgi:hypothetical protein